MKPSPKVALIDLDGTLADNDKSHREKQEALRSPEEPPYEDRFTRSIRGEREPDYLYRRRQMIQSVPGFWSGLDRIERGFDVLQMIKEAGFEPHILTKGPSKTPIAWQEKVVWCTEHVPGALVTIASDKSMVYGGFALKVSFGACLPFNSLLPY